MGAITDRYMEFIHTMDPNAYIESSDSQGLTYVMDGVRQICSWDEIYADVKLLSQTTSKQENIQ